MSRKIQFKTAYQTYRVGDVVEPTAAHGDWLVCMGVADYVPEGETAMLEQPETAAARTPQRRRRRRRA